MLDSVQLVLELESDPRADFFVLGEATAPSMASSWVVDAGDEPMLLRLVETTATLDITSMVAMNKGRNDRNHGFCL